MRAFLISFLLATTVPFLAQAQLTIKTGRGSVEGSLTPDHQVRSFLGVPYAAPPIGDLRWQPPQPAAAWADTLSTKAFGHHCIQFADYAGMVFRDPGPSEDCLTLNIWTPINAKPGSLPVMVWIYGGGYIGGGTSEPRQDGQFLAHRNVVIVSMNYRLGLLGFLAHPELTAASPHHASGNYGLLDQAAAIAWVKRNIRAFGGDPANITLFGESAGSFSVSAQMASPLTKNLIAKAIGESGAAFYSTTIPFQPLAEGEMHDIALLEKAFGTNSLTALRKIPAETLATTKTFHRPTAFPPDIDGYFLPDTLANLYAAGKEAHIPLLAGWNADEVRNSVTFAKVKATTATFAAKAHADFGPNATQFLKLYPASTDAQAIRSAGDFASDRFIVFATWRWLEAHAANAPTYRYRLDLAPPADKFHPLGSGAFHSDDIEYVFGTLDGRQQATWRPEDRALSNQIQQYWTNFARTGNPNGDGLPQWPRYKPSDWMVLHLDKDSVAKPDDLRARYLFLNELWMK